MTGEQLKYQIGKRGFTQKAIADKLGITVQSLSGRLKDGKDIKSEFLEEIAPILGVTVQELYDTTPARQSATTSIREDRNREKELLRQMSVAAMQGLLASDCKFDKDLLESNTFEQCIAKLSVQQAYAMLGEFKKCGIDK